MIDKLISEKLITIQGKEYKLRKISKTQLFELRLERGVPGLVFKCNDELWFTELPSPSIRFNAVERKNLGHMCSSEYECCQRLSALPDPEGCACMRDRSFGSVRKAEHRKHLCKTSLRIEKYPFLVYAIETFNMNEDCFKVLECKNCNRFRQRNPQNMDYEERKRVILALAQHLNPDIEDLSELKANYFPEID